MNTNSWSELFLRRLSSFAILRPLRLVCTMTYNIVINYGSAVQSRQCHISCIEGAIHRLESY